ncbi:MerR family transcriptional regulator [Sphingomicrobium sediminis]|uniref:MerR family DNA-binding transcriptional regulator n=1 Tax=Sphingomicrobium sediminis TaxID=2950949 RepID=A0A9X2J2J4_9SPHN|nr:MerR family DNA-binding transcriptional regulator [Sphingomicrobium sediminis]MCM8556361.1 MerR family DNA-binding transcriptional regulator [Sphingomicrobium sediminis]
MLAQKDSYTIGEMCDEFDVTARALRFYEDENLISPKRVGTQRLYSDRDRARVAWILRGKRVGFSLSEIREMLDLYHLGDQRQTQRKVTLEKCQERVEALTRQKADIDEMIEELEGYVTLLREGMEKE